MVGLNHEFARKLLWREYPTDQRGSYFRQFWDVRSFIDSEGLSEDALQEKLYDIPELHRWLPGLEPRRRTTTAPRPGEQQRAGRARDSRRAAEEVSDHGDLRAPRGLGRETPTATIDLSEPRKLVPLDRRPRRQQPPRDKMRSPLYEAKADPDIYFFGFDLTIAEVKGGTGEHSDRRSRLVLRHQGAAGRAALRPRARARGHARGLRRADLGRRAARRARRASSCRRRASPPCRSPPLPPGDPEGKQSQRDDDEQVDAAPISSARWAYLLFRAPVMVAVHADEMLGTGS